MEGFQDVVLEAWNSVQSARCPFLTLDRKLKETAKRLHIWSEKQVGHIVSQLCLAKELLHKLEIAQDHKPLKKPSLLLASLLRDGDNIVTSQADKANLVDQFYSNLIGQSVFRESTIDLEALGLPAHNLSTLDAPFTEQEVWETVSNLPSDKALYKPGAH